MNIVVLLPVTDRHRAMLESSAPGEHFTYTDAADVTEGDVAEADVIIGNVSPVLKKKFSAALPAIIMLVFFSMGSTMTFGQLVQGGLPGILLGVICSVVFAIPAVLVDRATGGTGTAGAAISSCAGANVATPAAMASVNEAAYGGAVLATATAQVAACSIVTAILTPIVTSWVHGHDASKSTTTQAAA